MLQLDRWFDVGTHWLFDFVLQCCFGLLTSYGILPYLTISCHISSCFSVPYRIYPDLKMHPTSPKCFVPAGYWYAAGTQPLANLWYFITYSNFVTSNLHLFFTFPCPSIKWTALGKPVTWVRPSLLLPMSNSKCTPIRLVSFNDRVARWVRSTLFWEWYSIGM